MDSKLLLAALVILAIVQLSVASDDAWQKHIVCLYSLIKFNLY